MSALTPLSFRHEKGPDEPQPGRYQYPPIGSADHPADSPATVSARRMKQLETMLQEVQGRAEIVEKEAYDKAYLAGEKAGMALGKKRAEQILVMLENSLHGVEAEMEAILQSFGQAAMDVAGFVARQVVADAIVSDKSRLWKLAKQAVDQLPAATELTIAVSPDDFSTFSRLLEDSDSLSVLCSDAATQSGTCRIISSQQDILIDPVAAVADCLDQLRPALLHRSEPPRSPDHEH